jgi:F-type H+-transporting ATPase subunit alpha
MEISAAEITTILKSQIKGFDSGVQVETVGTVLQVGDGVARIHGLKDVMVSEMLEFPDGVYGIALNLEEDNVGAVILGDDTKVKEGDTVRCTGRIISVPVGEGLVGRVVNAIGQAIDGKGPIVSDLQ